MKTKEINKESTIIVSEADMSSEAAPFIIYEMKYSNIEKKIATLEEEKDKLKKEILAKFEEVYGHESKSITNTLTGNTLQRIISVMQSIDEDAIKKAIPADMWDKITTRKISRDLFFAAIKMGEIEASEVSLAITTKEVDKLAIRAGKKIKQ